MGPRALRRRALRGGRPDAGQGADVAGQHVDGRPVRAEPRRPGRLRLVGQAVGAGRGGLPGRQRRLLPAGRAGAGRRGAYRRRQPRAADCRPGRRPCPDTRLRRVDRRRGPPPRGGRYQAARLRDQPGWHRRRAAAPGRRPRAGRRGRYGAAGLDGGPDQARDDRGGGREDRRQPARRPRQRRRAVQRAGKGRGRASPGMGAKCA